MDEYTVSKEYLDEVITSFGQTLVGQIMRRFEMYDSKDLIKRDTKELIYENLRDLKAQIRAFSCGVKFITPKVDSKKSE